MATIEQPTPVIPRTDVEIRLYNRITGERLPLDPDKLTGEVSVELTEAGGVDTIKATLSRPFDASDAPSLGCLMDVIVHSDPIPAGQYEPFPRYRGILAAPEAQLDLAETFSLFGYGLLEDMSRVPLDTTLAIGGEADLAQLAAQALDYYVAARPWLMGRFEKIIENTGVKRTAILVEDGDCRGALDAIANEAPGLIVWGWRVSPTSGAFQFVFRARTEEVGYRVAVGENVQRCNQPAELAKVQNEALLSGGPSETPNILGVITGNATFAKAGNGGATGANLLSDPDFDNRQDATLSGGASYKAGSNAEGNTLSEGQTFSGGSMVELDNPGEKVSKRKDNIAASLPPVGQPISIVVRYRLEVGTDTRTATANFYWRQGGNRMPGGPHATLPLAPDTAGYWPEAKFTCTRIAGSDGVEVEVVAGAGSGGLMVGYLSIYDAGRLVPNGWDPKTYGSAVFNAIDPLYPLAWPGNPAVKTSLRLSVSASDADEQDAHLQTIGQATGPCRGNQTVTLVFRARRTPGSTAPSGKMFVLFRSFRGSGEETSFLKTFIPTGTFGDDWVEYQTDFTTDNDAENVTVFLAFRSNTDLLISCIQLRDASAGTDFIRGANWERIIRASELCDPGSPAALSASVYDVRFGRVTNSSLKLWDAGAQAWAKAFLTVSAVPPKRARLSLIHEAVQRIDPLDGTLLRLLGTAADVADEYPSRVSYRLGTALGVDVELGGESPSLQRLLAGGKDRQSGSVSAGGSGGATVSSSSGSGAMNDSLNGIAAEVIAARSSAATSTDFPSVDARLESIEESIASGGSGTGDMLKSVYDPNNDGIIDVVQGGTGAATAAAARTNLGLGTMATQNAAAVAITGGSVTGIVDLALADGGTGASTASAARNNLGLGSAAVADTGTGAGNVPLLDGTGKLSTGVLPAIAITSSTPVASQAAMLALVAEEGDVAIRTDINKSFILSASPASTLANWLELRSPTDMVQSVNGRTGVVTGLLESANNLSDVASPGAARNNLGLGSSSTRPASDFAAASHTHDASAIVSGVLPIARLATGMPNGSKFIRDDGTLATPPGSSAVPDPNSGNIDDVITVVDDGLGGQEYALSPPPTFAYSEIVLNSGKTFVGSSPGAGQYQITDAKRLVIRCATLSDNEVFDFSGTSWAGFAGKQIEFWHEAFDSNYYGYGVILRGVQVVQSPSPTGDAMMTEWGESTVVEFDSNGNVRVVATHRLPKRPRTLSSAATLALRDIGRTVYLEAGTSFTVTFPTAVGYAGQRIVLKKKGVAFGGGHTAAFLTGQNGQGFTLMNSNYQCVTWESDGAQWWVISSV